jgi:hypothetical protein
LRLLRGLEEFEKRHPNLLVECAIVLLRGAYNLWALEANPQRQVRAKTLWENNTNQGK